VIKGEAGDDLARIYEFNIDRSASWADKVEGTLLERAHGLGATPHAGRLITRAGTRRLSVPDIQYVIDYQLRETMIEVLRFQHTREIR
jgi:plasmid stabilization system protein ParE